MRTTPLIAGALALTATFGLAACGSSSKSSDAKSAATTQPAAKLDTLSGKATSVTLASSFVQGLTSLKLTPGTVGTAKLDAGVVSFPITGGNVTYWMPGTHTPYVEGAIKHDGSGISLTGGGIKVELTDFVVDPGQSVLTGKVTANGKVAAESAPLFFLDGRTLKPLASNADGEGTATLEGTTVSLTKTAADLLNKTYGTTALTEFFPVGVAKIVVNTK
jgi:hypothetical protein